ncbi:FHA modulated ABC efflux pump with fused ATPase and integral membrane subunit [Actinomycetospora succinea]|uniref:FHA modulated ABC efflux pump with fused ATPase and integral membrane subunit n=1 Tax=Actinomycetospora succinea TaxID=663603 RepID=A0A4R6VD45_9PSEU|nr:ATP-binding cassette domain-containing protein [Actinomycetospora succinea]TDQ58328.1 FHA modulated ABC efflux pump with fused ATPase and integral membrane subunit [Actinomycetospora succinea]
MHPVEPVPRPVAGRRAARGRPLTAPQLELTHGDRHVVVPPGQPVTIGRDEAAGFQVVHPLVSRVHAELRPLPTGWELLDRSQNGVFVAGERLQQLRLSPGATPRLTLTLGVGGPEVTLSLRAVSADPGAPPVPMLAPLVPPAARPARPPRAARPPAPEPEPAPDGPSRQGRLSAVHRLPSPPTPAAPTPAAGRIRIGRETDNDVVVHDLLVSRHHAELVADGAGGWELVDLGSPNGTYVDGRRIRRAPLRPGMLVGIGHALFHLDGDRLVEREDAGAIAFRAQDLVVRTAKGRTLLDRVGFALEENSLLAVVGPSGAGKSTLLRALTGFRPADEGTVTYADRDLYADYDELRQRIGLVPQDDILHPQLTVRRALAYAARLRFPSDTTETERDRRIEEVIGELGLVGQADQRIDSLSGGQRKRTSVALELLTRPSLLFLDEPTSGLDPGLDKSVMHTLRGLADDGRTVVVVTHNVANLDVCDRLLLLAPGGTVAYFGPPQEALTYFGVTDFADLFLLLERSSGAEWAERFRNSAQGERYIGTPPPSRPVDRAATPVATTPPPRQQSAIAQFAVLCRRYLAVIAADRQYTIFMVALPLLLAALSHALPVDTGLSLAEQMRGVPGAPQSLLMVFVVGAALMGSAASIRELVKEREIYRRERAIGLARNAYLLSKVVVLGLVTGLQGIVLGVLGQIGRPGPDEAVVLGNAQLEILVAIAGITIASMAVGLAVSAWIDNADRGMPLLVLLAMLQFILSSALLQIQDSPVLAQLSWFVPARWGFAMGASTIGVRSGPGVPPPYTEAEPLWDHTAGTWLFDLGALAGVTVLFVVVTALLLRRLDPRAGRTR